MTTEKYMMLIKNITNKHIGEEENIYINKMKEKYEDGEVIPKNIKIYILNVLNNLLNGDENLEENFMNIQFNENDINFLKDLNKTMRESKMFPSIFDIIDDDDYDFLLDMKNETFRKRLEEKYRDIEFSLDLKNETLKKRLEEKFRDVEFF